MITFYLSTKSINSQVEIINKRINEISNIGQKQEVATEGIFKAMEWIAESANKLK